MPVNASNLEKFPLFTPKFHTRVWCVVWIILQLQRTVIENSGSDTIDIINTIDRIDCKYHYEYNRYDRSNILALQTSSTQWHHCCFIFRFAWFIKVVSIVVLQSSAILLVRSPLLCLLLMFATQSYSGTHIRGETALQKTNGLFLCISRSDVSSWISPTNRIIFLCYRSYQLQQVGSDNHVKCHSR